MQETRSRRRGGAAVDLRTDEPFVEPDPRTRRFAEWADRIYAKIGVVTRGGTRRPDSAYREVLVHDLMWHWADVVRVSVSASRIPAKQPARSEVLRLFPPPPPMIDLYLREPKWDKEELIGALMWFDTDTRRIARQPGLLKLVHKGLLWYKADAAYPGPFAAGLHRSEVATASQIKEIVRALAGGRRIGVFRIHPHYLATPERRAREGPVLELLVYSVTVNAETLQHDIYINHVPVDDPSQVETLLSNIAHLRIDGIFTPGRIVLSVGNLKI